MKELRMKVLQAMLSDLTAYAEHDNDDNSIIAEVMGCDDEILIEYAQVYELV